MITGNGGNNGGKNSVARVRCRVAYIILDRGSKTILVSEYVENNITIASCYGLDDMYLVRYTFTEIVHFYCIR